jgi:uncharacterized protein YegL
MDHEDAGAGHDHQHEHDFSELRKPQMPKLMNDDLQTGAIPGLQGYHYSAVRPDRLGESEYTLVTLALDVSSSVSGFRDLLIDTLKKALDACKKSPRVNNVLVRVITFSHTVAEVHGFKPLAEIDYTVYDRIVVRGNTALYDACASALGAATDYGRTLAKQNFGVTGILFIITDGADNSSSFTPNTVKTKADEALSDEIFDAPVRSVLVGVNASDCSAYLQRFQTEGGISEYIDAGDATPANLAKLAAFISRSVSSSSTGAAQPAPVVF